MENKTMIDKLQAAQALIYELLDNPALDSEANSSLYCADSCIGEAVEYLRVNSTPLATVYFQYYDAFLNCIREDQAPLYGNKTPEECANMELSKHFDRERRKQTLVKINFIQGA